jgi:hypothetical protein
MPDIQAMNVWHSIQKAYNGLAQRLGGQATTSDSGGPPSTVTAHEDKTKDLLAFRTIIMMLSFLQRLSPYTRSFTTPEQSLGPENEEDRKVLKVLDSLSTILVRHNDIAAVVAQPYNGSSESLKVFASVLDSTSTSTESPLQPASGASVARGICNWINNITVTINPRRKNSEKTTPPPLSIKLGNTTTLPLISDCRDEVPAELIAAAGGASATPSQGTPVLDLFLQKYW